jgi:alkanesulfonate monooxygenase SsuD/methylene tetrahydromethanopterin reductase-like flavin-dependent oxidoreductase (luciferase family)
MAELRRLWRTSEDLGFDWISVWDHFYANPGDVADPCFEAVACQAALAATTSRVRVGSLVYSAGYRHPALLAKAAVTMDHLSDGRMELGIGAGWHKAEYEGYGIPFESPGVRLRRLGEYVEIVRALWTQDVVNYQGEFYTLTDAYGSPKPVQRYPRIWVGATGPKALAQAGRLGDAWNTSAVSPEEFARRFDIVRSAAPHPDRLVTGVNFMYLNIPEGKFDEEIRRRSMHPDAPGLKDYLLLANDLDALGARVDEYVKAGVDYIILTQRAPFDYDALARFAQEIRPAFRS